MDIEKHPWLFWPMVAVGAAIIIFFVAGVIANLIAEPILTIPLVIVLVGAVRLFKSLGSKKG